jgi:hypothetical protein
VGIQCDIESTHSASCLDTCTMLVQSRVCMKPKTYDDAAIARIAQAAICDPRTVLRHLAGLPVRGKVAERIKAVVEKENRK